MEPTRSNDWRLVTVRRVLYSFLLLFEDSFERRKQFQKVPSPFPCAHREGREKIEGKKGKEEKRKEDKREGAREKKRKRGQKTGSIILCFF